MNYQASADKINAFKAQHNLTGARIALLCGVAPRTVRQWLSGECKVPDSCWRLLRIMVGEITVEQTLDEAEIFKEPKL
jgi:DNA-binding transcriptional regulator YiaG